jgi:ubiquitin carboxyl-terminal hydrolase 4/11/15
VFSLHSCRYCPQCKEHRRAWKKFDLWKLPEILVVHLKRFQYNRSVRSKLTFDVDFPLEDLDLDKYILNEAERGQKYDLFAISVRWY